MKQSVFDHVITYEYNIMKQNILKYARTENLSAYAPKENTCAHISAVFGLTCYAHTDTYAYLHDVCLLALGMF